MVLPNGPKFFIAFYGAVRIRAVPIPLGEGSAPRGYATSSGATTPRP